MTIQDLGNIGEFLASIGVLISIVYLAVQVRQANRLMMADYRETNRQVAFDINSRSTNSREFAELMQRAYTDPESLDDVDNNRVNFYLADRLLGYQSYYLRGELVGEDRMMRVGVNSTVRLLDDFEIARELWSNQDTIHPDFRAAVIKAQEGT